jgi:hypothetical protein
MFSRELPDAAWQGTRCRGPGAPSASLGISPAGSNACRTSQLRLRASNRLLKYILAALRSGDRLEKYRQTSGHSRGRLHPATRKTRASGTPCCAPHFKKSRGRLHPGLLHKPTGQNIAETLCHTILRSRKSLGQKTWLRKVNGFWVRVCQDVLISEPLVAENPIDCRIFFADNTQRKTESGIGGKNP